MINWNIWRTNQWIKRCKKKGINDFPLTRWSKKKRSHPSILVQPAEVVVVATKLLNSSKVCSWKWKSGERNKDGSDVRILGDGGNFIAKTHPQRYLFLLPKQTTQNCLKFLSFFTGSWSPSCESRVWACERGPKTTNHQNVMTNGSTLYVTFKSLFRIITR